MSPYDVCLYGSDIGYSYSAETASYAYCRLQSENEKYPIKRIFLIGPSHHVHLNMCAVSGCEELETPVGNLKVDTAVVSELIDTGYFERCSLEVEESEHSIEMHLPFIARATSGNSEIRVVPMIVDALSAVQMNNVSNELVRYVGVRGNVFIISSDFCHWGRRFRYQPYDESKGSICQFIAELDDEGIQIIENQDRRQFEQYLHRTNNTICGKHAISLFLAVLEKSCCAYRTKFTRYAQSSTVTNKTDSSVSYAAAIIELVSA